jgi:hypothetical protein
MAKLIQGFIARFYSPPQASIPARFCHIARGGSERHVQEMVPTAGRPSLKPTELPCDFCVPSSAPRVALKQFFRVIVGEVFIP